jgi:hypothetical protein
MMMDHLAHVDHTEWEFLFGHGPKFGNIYPYKRQDPHLDQLDLYLTCIQAQHMVGAVMSFIYNIQSQNLTQHRQYQLNLFNPSNNPLNNIPMGKMVHWFDGVQ